MASTAWQRFDFMSGNDDEDEEDEECSNSEDGWIQWFCRLEGHSYLCEVDDDYIRDSFNLYGLKSKLKNYDRAMEMVLGLEPPDDDDLMESDIMDLYRSATDLYGLIHARYIVSPKGLSQMNEKFIQGRFGYCPRVHCNEQRVLPVGPSDELRTHRVRVYCPKCQECYDPRSARVDGAFFGSSFPAIFLQAFSSAVPFNPPMPFVPKIFGFRIHNKRSIIQRKIDKGEYGWHAAEMLGSTPTICLAEEGDKQKSRNSAPRSINDPGSKPKEAFRTAASSPGGVTLEDSRLASRERQIGSTLKELLKNSIAGSTSMPV